MSNSNKLTSEVELAPLGSLKAAPSLWTGVLLVFLGATCISFSAVFVRLCTVAPETSSFYRMFFGAIALILVSGLRRESIRAPRVVYVFLGAASLLLCLDLVFWHYCIYLLGPGLATIIANFHVFFMAPAGLLLFKERLSAGLLVGLPLAMLGLALLVGIDGNGIPDTALTGLALGLTASFWYAGYVLVLRQSQYLPRRLSPLGSVTVMTVGCALIMALVLLGTGKSFIIPDMHNGVILVAYGVFCQALGWLFLTLGLPRLPASLGAPVMLLQPGLAFVWDVIFFDRPVNFLILLGAVVALSGIYLAVTGQMRKNSPGRKT